jgi:hypothetical protein
MFTVRSVSRRDHVIQVNEIVLSDEAWDRLAIGLDDLVVRERDTRVAFKGSGAIAR